MKRGEGVMGRSLGVPKRSLGVPKRSLGVPKRSLGVPKRAGLSEREDAGLGEVKYIGRAGGYAVVVVPLRPHDGDVS